MHSTDMYINGSSNFTPEQSLIFQLSNASVKTINNSNSLQHLNYHNANYKGSLASYAKRLNKFKAVSFRPSKKVTVDYLQEYCQNHKKIEPNAPQFSPQYYKEINLAQKMRSDLSILRNKLLSKIESEPDFSFLVDIISAADTFGKLVKNN